MEVFGVRFLGILGLGVIWGEFWVLGGFWGQVLGSHPLPSPQEVSVANESGLGCEYLCHDMGGYRDMGEEISRYGGGDIVTGTSQHDYHDIDVVMWISRHGCDNVPRGYLGIEHERHDTPVS